MSKFEDHLWETVLTDHGEQLSRLARPAARRSWRAPQLVAGTSLGLAGAGAAVLLLLGATATTPAFAVTRNHDGTFTVSIKQASGIPGANRRLHDLGIPARVVVQVPIHCQQAQSAGDGRPTLMQVSPGIQRPLRTSGPARWTIDPRRVPVGQTLVLSPPPWTRSRGAGNTGTSGTTNDTGTTANTGTTNNTGTTANTGTTNNTGTTPSRQTVAPPITVAPAGRLWTCPLAGRGVAAPPSGTGTTGTGTTGTGTTGTGTAGTGTTGTGTTGTG